MPYHCNKRRQATNGSYIAMQHFFFFFFFFFISTTQGVTREILHSLKRQLYLEPKIYAKCYEEKTTHACLLYWTLVRSSPSYISFLFQRRKKDIIRLIMSAVIKSSSKFSTRTSTKTFKSFGVEENEWSGSEEEAWRYTSGAYYTKDLSDDEQEEGGGGGGGSAGGDQSSAGQTITDSNPSVQGPLIDNFYSKREHNRSKFVSGQAKLKMTYLAKEEKQIILASKRGFHIPVPILSSLTLEHMGEELVEFMWRQFLDHDTDESGLVMVNKLPIIFHQIRTHFGYKIKVEELGLKALEDDDYIGFVEVCEAMTNVMPSIRPYVEIAEPKEARLHCCSHVACKHVNDETDQDEEEHEIDIAKKVKGGNYQLFVVFNQWVSDLNGKIRNKVRNN